MTDKTKGMALSVLTVPTSLMLKSQVISIMWQWFVSPSFNVANITCFQAMGLLLLSTLFTMNLVKYSKEEITFEYVLNGFYRICVLCGFILLVGFLAHSYGLR